MHINKPTSILILIGVIAIILGAILPGLGRHKNSSSSVKKPIISERHPGAKKTSTVDGNAPMVAENTASYDEVWGPVKMVTMNNLRPFTGKKIQAFIFEGHEFHHDSTCAACKGESVEK